MKIKLLKEGKTFIIIRKNYEEMENLVYDKGLHSKCSIIVMLSN